ncbi:hypothetical protein [Leptospira andrefontaineae]|uniref:Uncharacterized protein n=1 Tax=Leptospira andrefontaineae TaxID=2484976 RepID=A0A4R9GX61_9LEPT|nr:hypothetical protein [Leptospira andrefontaineae]TGK36287.1 hypothetical protein EHO65_18475 [Leptospira andrefontaineae]
MNFSKIAERRTHKTLQSASVGQEIYYFPPKEDEVIRDESGDIVGRKVKPIPLHAHPIQLNPGQRQLDRAGMKEGINAIFYISIQEYHAKISKDPVDIVRHRINLIFQGKNLNYSIENAKYYGTTKNGFRYVVIGGINQT